MGVILIRYLEDSHKPILGTLTFEVWAPIAMLTVGMIRSMGVIQMGMTGSSITRAARQFTARPTRLAALE